jgi:hypothetical protein
MNYYIKQGKRYKQINDTYALDGLYMGSWLVIVKPGTTSICPISKPEYAKLDVALSEFKEVVVKAMFKASELRPKVTKLSKKEQKAWKAYEDIMGKDKPSYFYYPSLNDIVQEGCEAIKKLMIEKDKTLKDDTMKADYKVENKANSMAYLKLTED